MIGSTYGGDLLAFRSTHYPGIHQQQYSSGKQQQACRLSYCPIKLASLTIRESGYHDLSGLGSASANAAGVMGELSPVPAIVQTCRSRLVRY